LSYLYRFFAPSVILKKEAWVMSATAFIRRFVFSLKDGEIFSTRDCLNFGDRSAVDHALSRLVKQGIIRRLARGIFARDPDSLRSYSFLDIAKLKGGAFGRKITSHPTSIASQLGLQEKNKSSPPTHVFFSTDGPTTKFRVGETIIHLISAAPRKLRLCTSKAGDTLRALWHLGKTRVDEYMIERACQSFFRQDRADLRMNIRWIPAWLSDSFRFIRRWEPVQAG
jgi:hypothetical protein